MKLVIAEKPELGRAIAEALPGPGKKNGNTIEKGEFTICWALGHLLRNRESGEIEPNLKKWTLDSLPIYFPSWEKTVIEGKEDILNTIVSLIKESDEIIHAGDPDDEGQYLIDEILDYAKNTKPVKRILINDNSPEAVKKALKNLENNDKFIPLGKAAEARSVSDILLGINLSRFFTLYNDFPKPLTVGRVQTPTLALVVRRDNEIKNHVKEKYYELFLKKKISNIDIELKYNSKENIQEKNILENIINEIKEKKGMLIITKKEEYISTPFPFNLSKLQIEGNKKFGYSVQQILDITQSLREKHKAITYNRSDCEYLSEEHFKEASSLIPELLKKLSFPNIEVDFSEKNKSRCFNDSNITAHHAIIPTFHGNLDDFSEAEKNIYLLIAKRYIIQFMKKQKIEKTDALLTIEDIIFKATEKKILDLGYAKIYQEEAEEEKEEKKNFISTLSEGEYELLADQGDLFIVEKETKPKTRYTEASLLQDMTSIAKYVQNPKIKEVLKLKDKDKKGLNGSIGTPATQANIINDLFKRGYIEKRGKSLISTELAQEYLKILPESLKNPDSTALWWTIQEEIKEGKATPEDLISSVLEDVKEIIQATHSKISDNVKEKMGNKPVLGICPKCGGEIRTGEKNYYCSNYKVKNCNFTLWKKMKIFGQKEVSITDSRVKTLLSGKSILLKEIPSKSGKKYDAYFKLEITEKYVNLKFDKFSENKEK